ncbi:MAG: ATP-binding cassette domain-containing protein, partial [Marinirhabdus sp.]
LKILFGTLKADTLVLKIDGKQVNPRHNMVNQHISYLPQHPFLPKRLRVRDIVPIMHPGEEQQDAIFYDPHIAAIATKNVWELSLGESKYLGVTLLGHLPHPFMLLDEPFSMLEPQLVHTMKQFLNKVKKRKGIIITDHYYRDVLDIADTNFVIKDGISHSVETENELKEFDYLKKSNN